MDTFDVSPLVPEARQIALAAANVYWQHTHPWFISLLVHGSAFKGGFIPGCSDIDFQLYLEDAAFNRDGELPIDLAIAIQRDLAQIDTTPFQYIQTYAYPPHTRKHDKKAFVGPVAGAYHMLRGELPIPEATLEQVMQGARRTIERAASIPTEMSSSLLGYGGGRLHRAVRLLCASIWPVLYSMLTCQVAEPMAIWRLPKDVAIAMLPEEELPGRAIRLFYHRVYAYYSHEPSLEAALAVIEQGVAFAHVVERWYYEEYNS